MELNFSNRHFFKETELKKMISILKNKIQAAKVGKASSEAGSDRSAEFNTKLKNLRGDYQLNISKLKTLESQAEKRKRRIENQKQKIEKELRKQELEQYQKGNDSTYSYITNFNKSYRKVELNNHKVFNTYI